MVSAVCRCVVGSGEGAWNEAHEPHCPAALDLNDPEVRERIQVEYELLREWHFKNWRAPK